MKTAVVIEDQTLFLELITLVLEKELGYKVAAQARDGEAGLEACLAQRPDLVMLDLSIPKLGGQAVLSLLKKKLPDTPVAILTASLTPETVRSIIDAGANGLLTKDVKMDRLKEAITQVGEGAVYVCPEACRMLRESGENAVSDTLSAREREILRLVGEGRSSKEIASMLSISARTVESHRGSVMRKLGLRGAADMARMAIRMNLVAG